MTYEEALAEGQRLGAGVCDDAAAMALFCAGSLQHIVGAVSPKLVWEGAQKAGLSLLELGRLCAQSPKTVHELMWR